MKHGENDVDQQISIQSIHLSAFGIIFGKEKKALRFAGVCLLLGYRYDIFSQAHSKQVNDTCINHRNWQKLSGRRRSSVDTLHWHSAAGNSCYGGVWWPYF